MFHLGYYSTELFGELVLLGGSVTASNQSSTVITGVAAAVAATTSEGGGGACSGRPLDLPHQAFELALDSQTPISSHRVDVLCFVYLSSITNRICLLQTDAIIAYSRLKSFTQLKYRCENVFTKRKSLSYKLYQAVESQGKQFDSKMIYDILYPD